ncbi:DNA polymerase III subunit delta' [Streptococcus sp. DD12]|uniref:DNA polymerase III subunit delta' n=1 Tax=Streptococcus sp. DD12 TaxID=1777880 RepID=UPI00079C0F63|nr:DNA polymerase III subunit delta' [Streptococcus sp. DD12]KXT76979.1 DNA polymerase III delta prime subunit [Streptococcus sp. DD12]
MSEDFPLQEWQPERYQEFTHILANHRLSHAYLFSGSFGAKAMAQALAQSLFCEVSRDAWPCGQCRSCRLIAAREFSDVKWIAPEGQTIKTQTIREMTREFSQSGYEGEAQVFIIQEAEKMHVNAANSLLKFIEEPQSASYVFFLTTEQDRILPTIRSRVQSFHFSKNRPLIQAYFEQAGHLPSKAKLLTEVLSSEEQMARFVTDKHLLDLVQAVERFVKQLEQPLAFIEADRLASKANDKEEQAFIFQVLVQSLRLLQPQSALHWTQKAFKAQAMWQSHVSFQNALEYMVMS